MQDLQFGVESFGETVVSGEAPHGVRAGLRSCAAAGAPAGGMFLQQQVAEIGSEADVGYAHRILDAHRAERSSARKSGR